MHIQVELWMGLGKELGEDFQSPSTMISRIELEVEEGMTIRDLFDRLGERYPAIARKIFDRENKSFYSNLTIMATFEGRIISFPDANGAALRDGEKILVLPFYAGG
jgi:molybdopterin converting factor small subunit